MLRSTGVGVRRQASYYNPSTLEKQKINDFEMRSLENNHLYVVIIHHRSGLLLMESLVSSCIYTTL